MKNINKFINDIITEAALDARIPDGIVNLKNIEHLQVIAEAMYDACENEKVVNEFLETFVDEGKYPDRQAYNKDGWLVTFPSAEYKKNAIRKGTHFPTDPTHGQGGMNLYYKKHGKQKRQVQQAVTKTDTTQEPVAGVKPAATGDTATPSTSVAASSTSTPSATNATTSSPSSPVASTSAQPKTAQKPSDDTTVKPAQQPTDTASPAPDSKTGTAGDEPIQEPVTPSTVSGTDYAQISLKFVSQKGWMPTPYNEYKDTNGNTVAVVGLTGEVVPVKNTDREEYKIFAEKNKV